MKLSTSSLGALVALITSQALASSDCQNLGNQRFCVDAYGNKYTTEHRRNVEVTTYSHPVAAAQQSGDMPRTLASDGQHVTTWFTANQTMTFDREGHAVTCVRHDGQQVC